MKKLILQFATDEQYQAAAKHFDTRSNFYPSDVDECRRQVVFEEECNLKALQDDLDAELSEYGITGYWFMSDADKEEVIIEANREGYGTDQVRRTMTVRELIDYLEQFNEDAKVYLSHDNGYTYGGITENCFK